MTKSQPHFHPEIFRLLIEHGADVNFKSITSYTLAHYVVSDIHEYTVQTGISILCMMAQYGANFEQRNDSGRTVLDEYRFRIQSRNNTSTHKFEIPEIVYVLKEGKSNAFMYFIREMSINDVYLDICRNAYHEWIKLNKDFDD